MAKVMNFNSILMAAVLFSLLYHWTTTEADLIVNITYLETAISKGAVCLDGSAPAFHFYFGTGSGMYSWLIHLQGGRWCEITSDCQARAATDLSSKNMTKIAYFTGVLSIDSQLNPNFYNWNRVKVKYCDGSSYTGDIEEVDPDTNLHFRGARIFEAIMEYFLGQGMIYAQNAILSGTSAGGLGAILSCDKFRLFLPLTARVKCVSDAGFFVNKETIYGEPLIEEKYKRVVALHGICQEPAISCTALSLDPSLCFFPQYAARHICTPLFIVNTAYDSWQINNSFVPRVADPNNEWLYCNHDINICSPNQIQTLQGQSCTSKGYFISFCHFHNGIEIQRYWSSKNSPTLANVKIAEAVGD
ncbi:pectin acetylesterase 8-like [Nicotiana tabacum]|uniref:Pectin acetylesterase 8-like n=1 Tax=Nicotiana tabacum TaxID=4097 RepID=A0AC58SSG4_TOBAC